MHILTNIIPFVTRPCYAFNYSYAFYWTIILYGSPACSVHYTRTFLYPAINVHSHTIYSTLRYTLSIAGAVLLTDRLTIRTIWTIWKVTRIASLFVALGGSVAIAHIHSIGLSVRKVKVPMTLCCYTATLTSCY